MKRKAKARQGDPKIERQRELFEQFFMGERWNLRRSILLEFSSFLRASDSAEANALTPLLARFENGDMNANNWQYVMRWPAQDEEPEGRVPDVARTVILPFLEETERAARVRQYDVALEFLKQIPCTEGQAHKILSYALQETFDVIENGNVIFAARGLRGYLPHETIKNALVIAYKTGGITNPEEAATRSFLDIPTSLVSEEYWRIRSDVRNAGKKFDVWQTFREELGPFRIFL